MENFTDPHPHILFFSLTPPTYFFFVDAPPYITYVRGGKEIWRGGGKKYGLGAIRIKKTYYWECQKNVIGSLQRGGSKG